MLLHHRPTMVGLDVARRYRLGYGRRPDNTPVGLGGSSLRIGSQTLATSRLVSNTARGRRSTKDPAPKSSHRPTPVRDNDVSRPVSRSALGGKAIASPASSSCSSRSRGGFAGAAADKKPRCLGGASPSRQASVTVLDTYCRPVPASLVSCSYTLRGAAWTIRANRENCDFASWIVRCRHCCCPGARGDGCRGVGVRVGTSRAAEHEHGEGR